MKAPKPVKAKLRPFDAWCVVQDDGGVPIESATLAIYSSARVARDQRLAGERVARARVVPAATAGPGEERLRRALREVRRQIAANAPPSPWRTFLVSQIDAALAPKRAGRRKHGAK